MSKFSEYLDRMSSAGTLLGRDESFVVHLTKAREKMAVFQRDEPAYCFLKWYQAAVVGGAQEVYFELDKDCQTMIMPFPEQPDLTELLQAFDGGHSDLGLRDRLLLEGLLSSTSAELETSISTSLESHVLSAGGLQKEGWWSRLLAGTRGAYKRNSLQIRVKMPGAHKTRPTLIATLQERTRFGPVIPHFALDISKQNPSVVYKEVPLFASRGGPKSWYRLYERSDLLLEHWGSHLDTTPGLYRKRPFDNQRRPLARTPRCLFPEPQDLADVVVAVYLELEGEATLIPVQHGVTLAPLHLDIGCPGAVVAFSAEGLDTDLSGFHLRESEARAQRLQEVQAIVRSVLDQNRSRFESLESLPRREPSKFGVACGAFVGFLIGGHWSVLPQLGLTLASAVGWRWTESWVRRVHLDELRQSRTADFQKQISQRLFGEGRVRSRE